jgi:hypothetical protein
MSGVVVDAVLADERVAHSGDSSAGFALWAGDQTDARASDSVGYCAVDGHVGFGAP